MCSCFKLVRENTAHTPELCLVSELFRFLRTVFKHALNGVGHEVNNFLKAPNIKTRYGTFFTCANDFLIFKMPFKMKIYVKFLVALLKTEHHIFCPGFFFFSDISKFLFLLF